MKYTSRFEYALLYAARLHSDQLRKGEPPVPFISHLMAVSAIVIENGGSEDEAIAALLHDAVEDQGGTRRLEEIRLTFGENVAAIVAGCTDSWETPKRPWGERKEEYIAHLTSQPPSVLLVSCADKVHNARTILEDYRQKGDKTMERFKGGKAGTLWYYRALVDTYRAIQCTSLVDELDRIVTELERLAL